LINSLPTISLARRYDALMIGGSGEYFVSRGNLPNFKNVLDFINDIVAAGHPMFASCFGFQLTVEAMGGKIKYLPEKMELGTYKLFQTDAGKEDELFSQLTTEFDAHLGHKDQAVQLPSNVNHLAYSKLAPFQAIRVPNQPIWATQFHPEVSREENLGRFKRYIDIYSQTMSPDELSSTIDQFTPAPESRRLIPLFMKTVFGLTI
jgi:GMP synthase (glutamine-hydrolysing)